MDGSANLMTDSQVVMSVKNSEHNPTTYSTVECFQSGYLNMLFIGQTLSICLVKGITVEKSDSSP